MKKELLKGLAGGIILGLLIAFVSGYFMFKSKVSTTSLVANRGIMIPTGTGDQTFRCITVSNYWTFPQNDEKAFGEAANSLC